jgi:hypothetical protein
MTAAKRAEPTKTRRERRTWAFRRRSVRESGLDVRWLDELIGRVVAVDFFALDRRRLGCEPLGARVRAFFDDTEFERDDAGRFVGRPPWGGLEPAGFFWGLRLVATTACQCPEAGERCRGTEVLFDPKQLVVLGDPIRTGRGPSLDLSRIHRHG